MMETIGLVILAKLIERLIDKSFDFFSKKRGDSEDNDIDCDSED